MDFFIPLSRFQVPYIHRWNKPTCSTNCLDWSGNCALVHICASLVWLDGKHWISARSPTRWFKPWPYYPRSLEVTNNLSNFDLRGHLTIPKRSPAARNPWFPTPPCGRSYLSTWGCQAASRRWRVLGFVPPWGGRKRRTTDFSDLRHTTWVFLQTPQKNKNIVFLSGCTTYLEDHLI